MHGERSIRDERPQLKIIWDDGDSLPAGGSSLSVEMTLTQFFRTWFLVNVCEAENQASGTIDQYRTTVRYWELLTGDPPLKQIDEFTISRFAKGLRSAKYTRQRCRSGVVLKDAAYRELGGERVSVHLKNLRAVLNRTGAQLQAGKPTARLPLPRFFVRVPAPPVEPKECFSLDVARAMVLAGDRFLPPRSKGIHWGKWWRGYLAGLYVTGVRPGTVRQLTRADFQRRPDGWRIKLPSSYVSKTHKGKWILLPDWCAEAMLEAGSGDELFACGPHRRTIHSYHEELQQLAGVAEADVLPQKCWRNTHIATMERLGLGLAQQVGQRTADHSHLSTTSRHYFDITEELRRTIPCFWLEPPAPPPPPVPPLPPPPDPQLRLFE